MAACLMLSGVGKSGSPAPKSTTSSPCARSFSASAETFMVDDTLMEEMRSAIGLVSACIGSSEPFFLFWLHPVEHPGFDRRRHQAGNIPAEPVNLLHQAGADEGINLISHHEHGFDIRAQPAINQCHLQLMLVIPNRPDAA